MPSEQIVQEGAAVIQAPPLPTLSRVAQALQARDHATGELSNLRASTEALIHDLTLDLQEQINTIREREEGKVAKTAMSLAEERDLADELYRLEVRKCVTAGIMHDNRYEIVNKTRVNHPIVPKRFYERWPEIFEKVVSIEKVRAEAALVADLGLKKTAAKARLDEVCDDVPSGPPQWELEVRKQKEGLP